jgi:hypothetical protein
MTKEIRHNGELMAIIVSHRYDLPGIHFFTPNDFSQQLAYMRHPAGKVIQPHVHKPVDRNVQYTLEVLLIKRGRLRVDFYDRDQVYISSEILVTGDVILLATGGHGFEVLEEIEMVEVKQGPYAFDNDKIRFNGRRPNELIFGSDSTG